MIGCPFETFPHASLSRRHAKIAMYHVCVRSLGAIQSRSHIRWRSEILSAGEMSRLYLVVTSSSWFIGAGRPCIGQERHAQLLSRYHSSPGRRLCLDCPSTVLWLAALACSVSLSLLSKSGPLSELTWAASFTHLCR